MKTKTRKSPKPQEKTKSISEKIPHRKWFEAEWGGKVFFAKVESYGKNFSYLKIKKKRNSWFTLSSSKRTNNLENFFSRREEYPIAELREVFERIMKDREKRQYFLMHLKIIR
jgi:hypothetical protein